MFVVLKIQKLADRLKQNNQLELSVSLSAMEAIIPSWTLVQTGVRNIDFVLKSSILPLVSNTLLLGISSVTQALRAVLSMDESGGFAVIFS